MYFYLCYLFNEFIIIFILIDHLKDLRSYLKYCGNTIFAGLTSTSTERNMIERLWEIYDNQEVISFLYWHFYVFLASKNL